MVLAAALALPMSIGGAACGSGGDDNKGDNASGGTTVTTGGGTTNTTGKSSSAASATIGKDACAAITIADVEAATGFTAKVNDRTKENGYMSYCFWDLSKGADHAGIFQLQIFPKQGVPAAGGGKNDIHLSNAVAITVTGAREAWADGGDWQKADSYHCNADAVPANENFYLLALNDSQAPVHPVDECQWAIKLFETAIKRIA
jgi:hypothetical protein